MKIDLDPVDDQRGEGIPLCGCNTILFVLVALLAFALFLESREAAKNNLLSNTPFTPTLAAAFTELKKGETITGQEYLGLHEMLLEKEGAQLRELAGLVKESTQEIINFLSDKEGVLVVRQKPWDGNSEHHL